MVLNPNHMTIVVNDVEPAKKFFSLLGFEEGETKLISGETMEDYLGVPGIEAEHVTLVLKGCKPYFDIQLLKYNKPAPTQNEHVRDLTAVGYNHMCFAVDDFDATIAKLKAADVKMRNGGMEFRNYKMAFIWGPEGITLELVQQLN
jgi:catechol 2,3-dioxygenase-like lactoylglutathione lyase family enzyme